MHYELMKVSTESDWQDYHKIRRDVLWADRPDRVYNDSHPDEYAANNHPFLLKLDGVAIGTARLDDLKKGTAVVRLVAIKADLQKRGHGRVLAHMIDQAALALGIHTLLVNAAPQAIGYYDKLGWIASTWDPSELTGIAEDCRQMKRQLTAEPEYYY